MKSLAFTNSFKGIRKDWENLYTVTPEVSPFLHPDAMKIAVRYFYPYYLAWKCRPIFAIYTEDDKPKAIIPLLKFLNGSYKLFGNVNGFNECGCVYTDIQSLKNSIVLLKSQIGSFGLARIDERSPLATFAPDNCKTTANVAISLGDSFDEYFKSLSSSVRQNVRTAYNRLSKDGYMFDCKAFIGGGNHLPVTEIIDLYCNRHQGRYGVSTSSLKRWFLKHQNFATRFYRYSPNALSFYLTIDGRPAAFLSGLFTKERLIVPRLSINEEFRRYSPGMILVCETIKYLINSTSIRILDLNQGEEEYKYKLGGQLHLSYRFNI